MRHSRIKAKLSESERRLSELDSLLSKLYEDWVAGRINETNFIRMMEKAQTEQETLQKKADMMRGVLTGRQGSRRTIQNGFHG